VRDSGILSDEIVQKTGKLFSFYYAAIQKGLATKTIRSYPLELIGEMLYRDIVAVMNLILTQPDPAKQEEYVQLGLAIFWNGIKA
jgi:hypothetical protein